MTERHEYTKGQLLEHEAGEDPFALFGSWLDAAKEAGEPDHDAMCLATVDGNGHPSARIVLLRNWDTHGFCFYTNYGSRKADELDARPEASVVFFWPGLERQIRIEGLVDRLDDATVHRYFASRPRASQLAAWASQQSTPLADRAELDEAFAAITRRFDNGPVPVPAFWGGYCLIPHAMEFWQGREHRLNDRLLYRRRDDGSWQRQRLAP